MLMRTDPFRELDRLTQAFGARALPAAVPMDAHRHQDQLVVRFDLPGVEPSSIDLTVEKNVLTVSAERRWPQPEGAQVVAAERPQGQFSRQLFLGEALQPDGVTATFENGVLTVSIPIAEQAKPRKVEIAGGHGTSNAIDAESSAA